MVKIFAIVMLLILANVVASKPYQYLEPRAGYVPVFIRYGNQPLSEINPLLAKAFREQEEVISKNSHQEPIAKLTSTTLASDLENELSFDTTEKTKI